MQINVIHANNFEAFNQLLFQNQHPAHQSYFQEQVNRFSNTLSQAGREFMEAGKAIYEKIHDSSVIKAAQAALRMVKAVRHPDAIWAMTDIDEMRAAKPVMARWMMTMPELREMYHLGLAAGYGDSYTDREPGKVREAQQDYRILMNGIVINAEEDKHAIVRHYIEPIPDSEYLNVTQQFDILRSHDIARMFMKELEDPSDIFGGKLPY